MLCYKDVKYLALILYRGIGKFLKKIRLIWASILLFECGKYSEIKKAKNRKYSTVYP